MPPDPARTAATEPQDDDVEEDLKEGTASVAAAPEPEQAPAAARAAGPNRFASSPARPVSAPLPPPGAGALVPPSLSPAAAAAATSAPAERGPVTGPPARLRYLESLADASHAISASLDLARVVEVLVDRAVALLDVPAAAVLLVEPGGRTVRVAAARGLSAAFIEAQNRPLEGSVAGRALAEGRTFATWDLRLGSDRSAAEAAAEEGVSSVACAPMQFAGRPVGALNLYCRTPHCFSEDQFHVLSLLAAQGAVAVANARAVRDLRTRAAEVRAGFQRVGEALSAALDLNETLRLIVQLSTEMTRADGGAMFLVQDEHEGGDLVMSAARGVERRAIRRFRRVPPSSVVRRALTERRVIAVHDTRRQTDTAFPHLRRPDGSSVETRAAVCVPVLKGDRPVGVLEQYAAEPGRFDKNDLQLLESFALQAAVAIDNARLYAQEKSVAQTLQRSFLPDLPRALSGFQIGRIYAPGSEVAAVGGDTYDLFPLPDGRIAALIADVSGQGTVAATLAVMAKYTVRAYALEDPTPARVLARANDAFVPQTADSVFVTLCYALLDPAERTVHMASAAHPPVLHCRAADRTCVPLGPPPGLIAGFLPDQEYAEEHLTLAPGDALVFYTDGVIEARRPPTAAAVAAAMKARGNGATGAAGVAAKPMYGQERLARLVAEHCGESAQEIANAIYAAVSDHTQGALNDDVALLVLKAE
jgi:serine phosphatase RsbU (regulator of sigma subunit)/putative methionine-R-sulfoxide reductase with GAF domain